VIHCTLYKQETVSKTLQEYPASFTTAILLLVLVLSYTDNAKQTRTSTQIRISPRWRPWRKTRKG